MFVLSPSLSKYMMTIYNLKRKKKIVYQIDIAIALGYSKASVSRAIHILLDNQFILIHHKEIDLTLQGENLIKEMNSQYHVFYQLLLKCEFNADEATYYANQLITISDEYFLTKLKAYFLCHNYE